MELKGKACLITGGTKGIGAATAVEFARLGADVAITGRRDDADTKRTVDLVARLGRRCEVILGDIAKPAEAQRAVEQTVAKLGGIDVLVHSAGALVPGKLLELTPEAWHDGVDVHVHAV